MTSEAGAAVARREESEPERSGLKNEQPYPRWHSACAIIPLAIAALVSISALWNNFATDDLQLVLNNQFIKDLSNLPLAFTTSGWSFGSTDIIFSVDPYFRPLLNILFTINYAFFGTAPWGWHLVNVLIHMAVAMLVFVVIKEAVDSRWIAVIAASLFAAHPVHSESVAWVSGVTDPLMTLLLLPAFYFYLRARKSGRIYLMVAALPLYFFALMSKETAIILPLVVGYCELFYFKDSSRMRQRIIRASIYIGLFALPIVIYLLMRYQVLSGVLFSSEPRYPLWPAIATIPLAVTKYLALMAIPTGYSYQHYTPLVESALSVRFIAPFVLLASLVGAVIAVKSRALTFAAVWFILFLTPALAAIRQFDLESLIQERYLYLPSIGFCLAVAMGIEWLATRSFFGVRRTAAFLGFTVAVVAVWGSISFIQNRVWRDTVTVYKNSVAVDPRSPVAHASLARAYYEAGRPREADAEARTALDLGPDIAAPYLVLSYFTHRSGKLEQAIDHLEQAISEVSLGPMTRHSLATVHLNLGLLYSQRKDYARAEENMLRSIEILPRPVAWFYTGQFYLDLSRFEEARAMFEQTKSNVPRWFAPVHAKLGQVYEGLGQKDQARAAYEKYLELARPDAQDRNAIKTRLAQL